MTFEQFYKIVIKRWGIVVICFLLVGLGAYIGSSKLLKPLYQSSVLVEVIVRTGGNPLNNDNILASQQLATTESTLATTEPVLGNVVTRFPGLSVEDLTKEVTAAPKDNTQLFEIDVLDPDPAQAAKLANDIAATLIKQQVKETQPTPAQGTVAQQGAAAQQAAAQGNFLIVAQPARPASSPARPNKTIYIGAGLVVGLLLGMLLAVLLELLDTRVRTKEALVQVLGWPICLGSIWKTARSENAVSLSGYSSNAESYSLLHTNIGFAVADKPLQTLVVTSSMPDDGKSTVAANLAINMAKAGKNVLLIDANLRHPTLHEHFNIPAHAMGFSNAILALKGPISAKTADYQEALSPNTHKRSSTPSVVTGELSLDPFVSTMDIPNLCVMPSGPLPPNPPELLDSKAMQRFFTVLSNCGAEIVIFDTPSLLDLSDAVILASKVDGTLVVVDTTCARKEKLKQAKMLLRQARASVLGCVVNKQPRGRKEPPYKNIPYAYNYVDRQPGKEEVRLDTPATLPVTPVVSKEPEARSWSDHEEYDGEHGISSVDASTFSEDEFDGKAQTSPLPVVREEGQVSSVKMAERISLASVLSIVAIPLTLCLGIVISLFNPLYAALVAGALVVGIILLLRQDEFVVMMIVAIHILVDAYLGFAVYQIALLMALILLAVCYLGRSADRPWTRPRLLVLWLLFLILTIFPTLKGGIFSLTNSVGYYLEIVVSPFIMFWLGNVIAKDMSAVRRVFQFLAIMAAIFAIHTIIEATTGIFLFESARAKNDLLQANNFQLAKGAASRVASFFGNPNGNGIFLATSFSLPLGLFVESKQFSAKIVYLLEMLAILVALMYTYSNGSWIAALVGMVVFMFLVGRVRYTVLIGLFMLALAAIAFTVFPTQIAVQLSHARDQGDLSLHLADWQTALRVIGAYPLFGVGLGSQAYLILSNPYRVLAQTKPLAEPDNSYLQWGAIAGIPVMLLFLLMLGIVFWLSWRNWLKIEVRYRPLLAGGIVALIALSINSLSVDGWTSPIDVQFLGWLIAGVVTSPLIGHYLRQRSLPAIDKKTVHSQFGHPGLTKQGMNYD